MTISFFTIVALALAVAGVLQMLEGQPVDGELVRREVVPVAGDRCVVRGVYRIRVDGAMFEQVVLSDVIRRDDDMAMRTAIRSLPAKRRLRYLADAPEVVERADGVAVPVVVRRAS
jgi:hypothetical protein